MSIDISLHPDIVMEAQQVLTHHAKSFRLASLFLPQKNANDAAVVYHFCRLLDDAIDEASDRETAKNEAEALHKELMNEKKPRPIIAAYLAVAERLHIPSFAAQDLLSGVCSDLGAVAIGDQKELAQYCYRVAGTVGLMMCGVLGVQDERALPYAIDLGLAMQLTNIARDVLEDAKRERVYLPTSILKKNKTSTADILAFQASSGCAHTVDFLLNTAEICYTRARSGMCYIPFRARLAIFVAMRVYRAIGLTLQRKYQSNPFHGRTIVSSWGKFWAVCHGIADFFDPRTWFPQQSPDSPFYTDWNELRGLS